MWLNGWYRGLTSEMYQQLFFFITVEFWRVRLTKHFSKGKIQFVKLIVKSSIKYTKFSHLFKLRLVSKKHISLFLFVFKRIRISMSHFFYLLLHYADSWISTRAWFGRPQHVIHILRMALLLTTIHSVFWQFLLTFLYYLISDDFQSAINTGSPAYFIFLRLCPQIINPSRPFSSRGIVSVNKLNNFGESMHTFHTSLSICLYSLNMFPVRILAVCSR